MDLSKTFASCLTSLIGKCEVLNNLETESGKIFLLEIVKYLKMNSPSHPAETTTDTLQEVVTKLCRSNMEFMWGIETARSQINKQNNSRPNTPVSENLRNELQKRIGDYGRALVKLANRIDDGPGHDTITNAEINRGNIPHPPKNEAPKICDGSIGPNDLWVVSRLPPTEVEPSGLNGDSTAPLHPPSPIPQATSEAMILKRTVVRCGHVDEAIVPHQHSSGYYLNEFNLRRRPQNNISKRNNELHSHDLSDVSYENYSNERTTNGSSSCSETDDSCSETDDCCSDDDDDDHESCTDDDNSSLQDVAHWGDSSDHEENRPKIVENDQKHPPVQKKCNDTRQASHESRPDIPESARLRDVRPRGYGANSLRFDSKSRIQGSAQPPDKIDEDTIPTIDDTISVFKQRNKPSITNADHYQRYLNEWKVKWEPLDDLSKQAYLERHYRSWKCFYCQVTDHCGGCISQISKKMCITTARRGIPCQVVEYHKETGLYNWSKLSGARVRLKLKILSDAYSFVCGNDDPATEQQFLEKTYQTRSRCICCILLTKGRRKGDRCSLQKQIRSDQGRGNDGEGQGLFKACRACQRTGKPGDCTVAVVMTRNHKGKPQTYGLAVVSWKVERIVNVAGPKFRGDCLPVHPLLNQVAPPSQLPATSRKDDTLIALQQNTAGPLAKEDTRKCLIGPRLGLDMMSTEGSLSRTVLQGKIPKKPSRLGAPIEYGRGHGLFLDRVPSTERGRNLRPSHRAEELISSGVHRRDPQGGRGLATRVGANPKKLEDAPSNNGKLKRELSPDTKINGDSNPPKMRPLNYMDKITEIHKNQNQAPRPKPNPLTKSGPLNKKYKY